MDEINKAALDAVKFAKTYNTIKCANCGEIFYTKSKVKIYCSIDCRRKSERERSYNNYSSNHTPSFSIRFDVLLRDKFTCRYCGQSVDDGVKLEIDHIIPISKGGENTMDNLVVCCQQCNLGKSDKLIDIDCLPPSFKDRQSPY